MLRNIFKSAFSNISAAVWNLLVAYIAMSICRVVFILTNYNLFADHMSWSYAFTLMAAGLKFDTTALLYGNAIMLLMFLLPVGKIQNATYYRIIRWIFTVINGIFVIANLADITYFPFVGKRATTSFFKEFGNEDTGEFLSILMHGIVQYWYLLLIGAALIAMLWLLFRSPKEPLACKPAFYVGNAIILPVTVMLTIFGIRGGTGVTTHPVSLNDAGKYIKKSLDAGIVLNTPFSIMLTLGDGIMEVPQYLSDEEASEYFTPVRQPSTCGQFKAMNVVILLMESFAKQDMNFDNGLDDPDYDRFTPFLDSLSQHCLTFKYSYSNGRKSIEAQPSVLSSIPNFVETFLYTPAALNDISSLPGELTKHKGYSSTYYHGGNNGTLALDAYANTTGISRYIGKNEYEAERGNNDFDGTWAIWDEPFLQFCCDDMTRTKEPFANIIFTASSHHPFKYPDSYEGKLPEYAKHPIQSVIAYSDNALRKFFDNARRQEWFDNTIFVIVADHMTCASHPQYITDIGLYCVPIMMYVPSMPQISGRDCDKVVDQIDIMPTVLTLMGYDVPYIAFGEDFLNTEAEATYAIFYVAANDLYEYIDPQYAVSFKNGELTAAYRYREDLLQTNDILSEFSDGQKEYYLKKTESIIQQYMQRMKDNEVIVR